MFHVRRLTISDFNSSQPKTPDNPDCWKVYGCCENAEKTSMYFLQRLKDWSAKDAKAATNTLLRLLHKSSTGKSLSLLFDERQCHWALTVKHKDKDVKVWRLWLSGVVRVFFCYGSNKDIYVAWALQKREDKLTSGEKRELETLFKTLLNAQEEDKIRHI